MTSVLRTSMLFSHFLSHSSLILFRHSSTAFSDSKNTSISSLSKTKEILSTLDSYNFCSKSNALKALSQ